MKTLQTLYDEIMGDDDAKEAFVKATKEGGVESFLKQHGCNATAEEVEEFLEAKAKEDTPLELSDEELDRVAGGSMTWYCSVQETETKPTNLRDCC